MADSFYDIDNTAPALTDSNVRFKLNKSVKLHHRSLVNNLFANGSNTYAYPLRMIWTPLTETQLKSLFAFEMPANIGRVQFMLTVPKKKHHHAVDRVLLRRRMREAFRLLRPSLMAWIEAHPDVRSLQIAFIYISPAKESFAKIQERMTKLLSEITQQ